jgi:cytochrome P450
MSDFAAIDFYTEESILADPFAYYEFVRRQGPVWREPVHGNFVVTGCDEITEIQRDYDRFSSCNSFGTPIGLPGGPHGDDVSELIEKHRDRFPNSESLVNYDPPRHTAHRALMMRLLTPKRLQENEAFVRRLADQKIDAFVSRGSCEFISEYAHPFAAFVIIDLMGVPESDHGALRASFAAQGTPGALGKQVASVNLLKHLEDWFTRYVADRRANPRDDVLTRLASSRFPDGSTPEVVDVVRVASFLYAGGQGTAARFLGNALKLLAERPEIQRKLRKEPERIPAFVEEVLRFNSPVKANFRMARKTTKVAGVEIPAGSNVLLLLGAAGRDSRRFGNPDEFDLERDNAREHIAFGRGIHSCPGAPLVRSEGRITVERMLGRLDDIRISDARHGPPGARRFEYSPSYILHGLDALHLEFAPLG